MKARLIAVVAAALLIVAGPVHAIEADEMLANPKLQARARAIDKELRCLVCQDESIDESNAQLAHDLRILVRQRLLQGDSDEQIKRYVVARYGNFVLLRPPFIGETVPLWLGPLFLLLCGGAGIWLCYGRRAGMDFETAPLSPEENRLFESAHDGNDP